MYNAENDDAFWKDLKTNVVEPEESNVLIGGDMNARIAEEGTFYLDEEEYKRSARDKVINREGKVMLEEIEVRNWNILNGSWRGDEEGDFTYVGNSSTTIDYVLANQEATEKIEKFEIITRTESDHLPLTVNLGMDEESKEKFKSLANNLEFNEGTSNETIEELNLKIDQIVSKKTVKNTNKKPNFMGCNWYDQDCKAKKREIYKVLRKVKKGFGEIDVVRKKRREYKVLCKTKREEKLRLIQEEIKQIKSETEAWKYINKIRGKKKNYAESSIGMEEWTNYFKDLLYGQDLRPDKEREQTQEIAEDITEDEFLRALKKLKEGKASGQDNIRNEVWLNGGTNIQNQLLKVFQRVCRKTGKKESSTLYIKKGIKMM